MRAPWGCWHIVSPAARGDLPWHCHQRVLCSVISDMNLPEQMMGSAVPPHAAVAPCCRCGDGLGVMLPCFVYLLGFLVPGRFVNPTAVCWGLCSALASQHGRGSPSTHRLLSLTQALGMWCPCVHGHQRC